MNSAVTYFYQTAVEATLNIIEQEKNYSSFDLACFQIQNLDYNLPTNDSSKISIYQYRCPQKFLFTSNASKLNQSNSNSFIEKQIILVLAIHRLIQIGQKVQHRNIWIAILLYCMKQNKKQHNHFLINPNYCRLVLSDKQYYSIQHQQIMSKSKAAQLESHIIERFNIIKKIGSGAYGHVWKVQQKTSDKIFALKKIFDAFQHSTDAQRTFREVQILQQTDHANIVKLYETIAAQNNKDVYLVFQYMESDLHNAIGDNIMKDAHFKFIIYQIAKALKYLHSGFIIHRDLKPSNVLVNSDCKIKLCDFGLVRSLANSNNSQGFLTEGVATRWYRAPQVLLGSKKYSTPADVWSFGCIIYEMIQRKPLFAGNSTTDQLQKIIQFTGMPSDHDINSLQSEVCRNMIKQLKISANSTKSQYQNIMKGIPDQFQDLITRMLCFNPGKRITIQNILQHPVLKPFRKQHEQVTAKTVLATSIDDNRKFTVDQYRRLVYKRNCYSQAGNSPRNRTNQINYFENQPKKQIKESAYAQALKKMQSCKNIYQANRNQKNAQQSTQICKESFGGSKISWKELVKTPSQALRLSGKIIAKKAQITINKNQSSKQPVKQQLKGKISITRDLTEFAKENKKYDQKTRIQKSQIPNICDISEGRFISQKIIGAQKMQLTKKSISNYQDAFSKAAELAKKNSDNTLFFSPKQKINKNSPSHDSNLFD